MNTFFKSKPPTSSVILENQEMDRLIEMKLIAIKWLKACYILGNIDQAKTWMKIIGTIIERENQILNNDTQ